MERLNLQVIGSDGLSEAAGMDTGRYRLLPDPKDERVRGRVAKTKRLWTRPIETARHESPLQKDEPDVWLEMDHAFMRRFLRSVRGQGEPPVRPETAIATVRLTREIFDRLQ